MESDRFEPEPIPATTMDQTIAALAARVTHTHTHRRVTEGDGDGDGSGVQRCHNVRRGCE